MTEVETVTTIEKTPMQLRDRVRLAVRGRADVRRWTVRALDDRFVVLTRQADFRPKGENFYTIIDWERGVRGPCNLIGNGWNVDQEGGSEALLRALNYRLEVIARLQAGEGSVAMSEPSTEVSYRNNVPIEVLEVRAASDHHEQTIEDA